MARILIAGASGLVGSHLVPLFGRDDEVHVIARDGSEGAFPDNVRVHRIDLGAAFDTAALPGELDAVVYLAQSENFRDFPDRAPDVFEVNVASLMRLLDHARRAGSKNLVYASSGGVYGSAAEPVDETVTVPAIGSLGFYLATKLCGEILCETYAPHMNVAVLRLFFVYGRGQRRSMLVPRLIDNIRSGIPIVLQGEDGIRFNPIHATDAAAACKAALGLDGLNLINVAGPETISLRALCELIGDQVGKAPQLEVRPGGSDGNLVADTTVMTSLLVPPRARLADHLRELF